MWSSTQLQDTKSNASWHEKVAKCLLIADCSLKLLTDIQKNKIQYIYIYIYIYQPWLSFPVGIFIDPSFLWLGFSSDILGRSPSFLRFQWLLNDPFDQDSLRTKLQGMSHFPQLLHGCPNLPYGKCKVPQESPNYSLPMHPPLRSLSSPIQTMPATINKHFTNTSAHSFS